jgi:DNA-binding MarR family transcriptional regulator
MGEKTYLSLLDMLLYTRDSGLTRNSQQSLLYHLVIRCRPKDDYSCFPGYDLLSRDTGLDITTLKRAARGLEEKGLVFRKVRHNHANLWYINFAEIQKKAEANRIIWGQLKNETKPSSPFALPFLRSKVVAPLVSPETSIQLTEVQDFDEEDENDCQNLDDVVAQVRCLWPEHPTFTDPSGVSRLRRDLASCIEMVGSPALCGRLMVSIRYEDEKPANR